MKQIIGYWLVCSAVAFALGIVAWMVQYILAWVEIFQAPLAGTPVPTLRTLFVMFAVVLILSAFCYFAIRTGMALINPTKYSKAVIDWKRLRSIYLKEKLSNRTFPDDADQWDYFGKTIDDLESIYWAIDRFRFPDRFEGLLSEIKIRMENGREEEEGRLPASRFE